MKLHRERAIEALEKIRVEDPDGLLRPEAVVEAARPVRHPLHGEFTWDDTEAAREYRLVQARKIIAACVTVVKKDLPPIQAYVSLVSDQKHGGGYRTTVSVYSDAEMRAEHILQLRKELKRWRERATKFFELKEICEALDGVGV